MSGDGHETHEECAAREFVDLPTDIPVQRSGADLVAPLTLDRPGWHRRRARVTRAVDAAALACVPALFLLWHGTVAVPLLPVVLSVVALAAAGRGALHWWLHRLHRQGRAMSTVLAIGTVEGVEALIARTRRAPGLGWRVDGACTPTGAGPGGATAVAGVPVLGDLDGVAGLALGEHFDAVAVGPAPGWTGVRLQKLAWDLDCSRTALLVDPRLVARAGARTRVTGVPGLPLLRLTHPTLTRLPRTAKAALDAVAAFLLLVLVAPVLVSCAVAVRRDGGPALRREPRLGRGGCEFTLLGFRVEHDAVPTPVGQVLRRHGLDVLPQLFNVLGGSMALVGPRPGWPGGEDDDDRSVRRRRLLVKPGITGLWQLPGWDGFGEENDGADLVYVRNWSPVLDARILVRTVRAAIGR